MSGARPVSPYLVRGFYDRALAQGRHREIVGGRWDETGRVQMALLIRAGLRPGDRLLDIGAGALRLGRLAVPWLEAGHYWATDASRALLLRGREAELDDPAQLPKDRLIEDAAFGYPGVPADIDLALAFAVFTHLPADRLAVALGSARRRFPALRAVLFTAFLGPEGGGAVRQADGVVTHAARPPYHVAEAALRATVAAAGFDADLRDTVLPRGQRLIDARPTREVRAGARGSRRRSGQGGPDGVPATGSRTGRPDPAPRASASPTPDRHVLLDGAGPEARGPRAPTAPGMAARRCGRPGTTEAGRPASGGPVNEAGRPARGGPVVVARMPDVSPGGP